MASQMPQLRDGWSGEGLTVLQRSENEGMDFAAHNVRPSNLILITSLQPALT